MATDTVVLTDSYMDSVRLLEATRAMLAVDEVEWAWAAMATPANLETLVEQGFRAVDGKANDLVLAARGPDDAVARTLDVGREVLFSGGVRDDEHHTDQVPADLRQALEAAPDTNLAIISVPGPFAALESHKALSAGLDVLLFSDNVPLSDEIALKQRARSLGRLVMGPGAGTAMIAGTGLAFSNRVRPGPVGVVAAAGTGAQEAMSLLHRWGAGVSHVIGVGGRDLSEDVGALMAEAAIEALESDDQTESILLVSKPPAPAVAERLLGTARTKPIVASLIGLQEPIDVHGDVVIANTLEQGVVEILRNTSSPTPDVVGDLDAEVASVVAGLSPERTRLVGLFSGGTLCYEAMTIAVPHIGAIHSNTPLDSSWTVPGPDGAHVCLDLGEEEYTQGRPHPMIDPEARLELLREQAGDESIAVVLIDVVLGDGSHPDPAGQLAPAAAEVVGSGAAVVAYVLGTDEDPQHHETQRERLRAAGCLVPNTAARGALAAAGIVNRDPALVHEILLADLGRPER